MFVLGIPLLGLFHKAENMLVKAVLFKKNTTRIDRKILELECRIKVKEDRIEIIKEITA